MQKRVRIAAIALVGALFLGSFAMVILERFDYRKGESAYEQAEELAGVKDFPTTSFAELDEPEVPLAELPEPAETAAPEVPVATPRPMDEFATSLAETDLDALREVNEEVVGWIAIPDTVISYPLMQSENNQKYLDITWEGKPSAVGAIFLERRCSPELTDFNTIIYGHRMNNGSMFATLKDYSEQSYFEEHPLVYIADDTGCRTYAVFASYEADTRGYAYMLDTDDEEQRQEFLDYAAEMSVIDTGIVPETDDCILTLSTCTGWGYDTRWVVQAVLL